MFKKIIIGSDHRGFLLKQSLVDDLKKQNLDVLDIGSFNEDSVDYPNIVEDAYKARDNNPDILLILICGSGIGVSIAANRYKDIRGALVFNKQSAISAREHNNANAICLAAEQTNLNEARDIINAFLQTSFMGKHHTKRIEQLSKLG